MNVLEKKSELQKEFENRQIRLAQKEKKGETSEPKTPFQLKLEEQAQKLKLVFSLLCIS